jgi:hypothetical protein
VVLAVVQAVVPTVVRQHYATPEHITVPLVVDGRPGLQLSIDGARLGVRMPVDVPGAWVTSTALVDASGAPYRGSVPQACEGTTNSPTECFAAINALHLWQAADYQPGNRYERFQGEEVALYAALSAALIALCFFRIRRMAPTQ